MSPIVLALVAQNENQALETGTSFVGKDLEKRGYRQHVINMMAPDAVAELQSFLDANEVCFAYGFAGIGSQFTQGDQINLWEARKIPFVALWYDHPCYNYRAHIVDSGYVINAYHLRDHIEARQSYLPAGRNHSVLLPVRFGIESPNLVPRFASRIDRILYIKTGVNPADLAAEWQAYPRPLQDVLWALVEMAQKDRNLDLAAATARLFAEQGQGLDHLGLFMGAVAAVDAYIRAWRSDKFARALLPHAADIVGRGWDYLKEGATLAKFFDPVPAHECIDLIQRYKIIANTSPLWRDGIHERVHLALRYGAASLTDRTQRSDEVFHDLPNYRGFEWHDDIPDVVARSLGHIWNHHTEYFSHADYVIQHRVLNKTNDYIVEIERAVAAVVS